MGQEKELEGRPEKRENRRMFFAAFALSLVLLSLVMVGTVLAVQPAMPKNSDHEEEYVYRPPAADTLTLALAGTDGAGKPMEFLLIRFNPQYGQLPLTLLPPEGMVSLDGQEMTLAEAYVTGGGEGLKQALEETLEVVADRYAVLSGTPFLRIAGKAGTVVYTLPYEISYSRDGYTIHFAAGEQQLDGQNILDLLGDPRLRQNPPEKSKVMGELIAATVNQNLEIAAMERASGIFKLAINLVKTDMTSADFELRRESADFLANMEGVPLAGNLPVDGEWDAQGKGFLFSDAYKTLVKQYFQPAM